MLVAAVVVGGALFLAAWFFMRRLAQHCSPVGGDAPWGWEDDD